MMRTLHKLCTRLAEAIEYDEVNGTDYTKHHRILRSEYRAVRRAVQRLERLERRREKAASLMIPEGGTEGE